MRPYRIRDTRRECAPAGQRTSRSVGQEFGSALACLDKLRPPSVLNEVYVPPKAPTPKTQKLNDLENELLEMSKRPF